MGKAEFSQQSWKRLPQYAGYLQALAEAGRETVSATEIAEALGMGAVQVRKDLAAVSSVPGRPMIGFEIGGLIRDMQRYMRMDSVRAVVLVGVGALGRALMRYPGFVEKNLRIAAGFDLHPQPLGADTPPVYPMEALDTVCRETGAKIGIIAVPENAAQSVADRLAAAGIEAIWNFSPTFLKAPPGVLIQNEMLLSSLALLMREMKAQEAGDK